MALGLVAKSNVQDAVIQKHIRLITSAKEDLDAATGEYRAKLKAAKGDGINQKQLLAAMLARKRDDDMVRADMRDYVRYLGLCMVSLKQTDLFDDAMTQPQAARAPGEDLSEHELWEMGEAGRFAGEAGRARDENPHTPGTEEHTTWDKGWVDGQAKIAKGMAPRTKAASTRRRRASPANDTTATLQ